LSGLRRVVALTHPLTEGKREGVPRPDRSTFHRRP
jgi:hypothetical protein